MRNFSIVFSAIAVFFCCNLYSQNPIWTLPSNYWDNVLLPLPTPTPFGNYDPWEFYDGHSANFGHNAMADANGNLLFFIVDGMIYDKDGYRIGEMLSDAPLSGELVRGKGAWHIVPAPNNKGRYYLFGTDNLVITGPGSIVYPFYAILDFKKSNTAGNYPSPPAPASVKRSGTCG